MKIEMDITKFLAERVHLDSENYVESMIEALEEFCTMADWGQKGELKQVRILMERFQNEQTREGVPFENRGTNMPSFRDEIIDKVHELLAPIREQLAQLILDEFGILD